MKTLAGGLRPLGPGQCFLSGGSLDEAFFKYFGTDLDEDIPRRPLIQICHQIDLKEP